MFIFPDEHETSWRRGVDNRYMYHQTTPPTSPLLHPHLHDDNKRRKRDDRWKETSDWIVLAETVVNNKHLISSSTNLFPKLLVSSLTKMLSNAPSSPVSSLSSLDSDQFQRKRIEEDGDHDSLALPSPKRRKVGSHTPNTYDSPMIDAEKDIPDDVSDISSDTSGSVQGSPRAIKELGMPDEDLLASEQVRACSWEGCTLGELANLDELVHHLTEEHVNAAKTTKYTCQWTDCKAKGKTQMSAYALKAHLRSHTKEKPFYCALPECDRSFTRSDALAKHMRTVHENEAPKTLEHYSKNPHAALAEKPEKETGTPMRGTPIPAQPTISKPPQKLKLLLNPSRSSAPGAQHNGAAPEICIGDITPLSPESRDVAFGPLPPDLNFTTDEASMSRHDLFRILRRQVHWAEQNAQSLNSSLSTLENMRKTEFLANELALENALEGAYAAAERKGLVGAWADHGVRGLPLEGTLQADLVMRDDKTSTRFWNARREEGEKVVRWLEQDLAYATRLPLQPPKGKGEGQAETWYRSAEWNLRKQEMERHRLLARGRRLEEHSHEQQQGPGNENGKIEVDEEDAEDVIDDAALLGDADEADDDLELPDEDPEYEEGEGEDVQQSEYKRRYRPYGPPVDGAEYGAGDVEEAMDIDATAGRLKGEVREEA